MRKLILSLFILLLTTPVYGANILSLTEDSTPTSDDMMYCVNDPGGTAADRKCTVGNVAKGMTVTNMVSSCTDAQVLGGNAAGTGVECQADANTTYTAGDALTLTGTDFDFDGGATPSGDLGGTWASPTVSWGNVAEGELADSTVVSSDIKDGTIAFADFGTDIITGATAVGTFASGDTFLCNEAGVGVRECDYDDLPGAAGGAPTDADYLVGTANGSLSAEIVVGTSPGGELGGTWASPTIDDSVGVSSWNLTTPTFTTNFTFDSVTATAITTEAEGIGNDDVDTSIPTNAAVVDYVANNGDGTGTDDQTIDVFTLDGTTLQLSLEDDGEATKEVDLSSLQDGTGTDDQTLAEVLSSGADANDVDITSLAKLEGVDVNTFIDMDGSDTIETKGNIIPNTDDADDLGDATHQFKNAYIDGTLEADAITLGGTALGSIYAPIALSTTVANNEQIDKTIRYPIANQVFNIWKPRAAKTITDIECLVDPADSGESVVLTIKECDGNGDSCAGVDGATTITCGNTTTSDDGTLSNGSIDANDVVNATLGTVTGTVTELFIRVKY